MTFCGSPRGFFFLLLLLTCAQRHSRYPGSFLLLCLLPDHRSIIRKHKAFSLHTVGADTAQSLREDPCGQTPSVDRCAGLSDNVPSTECLHAASNPVTPRKHYIIRDDENENVQVHVEQQGECTLFPLGLHEEHCVTELWSHCTGGPPRSAICL